MSEAVSKPVCDCPPPAERADESPIDPRAQLMQLAGQLAERYSARLLAEYLRLRRSVR
jgi:hypothetical protein